MSPGVGVVWGGKMSVVDREERGSGECCYPVVVFGLNYN